MSDPRDRSDALVVSYRPYAEPRERIVFEEHSQGGYMMTTQQYELDHWRTQDCRRVRDVQIDPPEKETKAGTVVSGP